MRLGLSFYVALGANLSKHKRQTAADIRYEITDISWVTTHPLPE